MMVRRSTESVGLLTRWPFGVFSRLVAVGPLNQATSSCWISAGPRGTTNWAASNGALRGRPGGAPVDGVSFGSGLFAGLSDGSAGATDELRDCGTEVVLLAAGGDAVTCPTW